MRKLSTRLSGHSEGSAAARELGWWVFVLLACAQFTIRLVWRGGSFLNLQRYAAGTEALPYQGRALMGWVLGATAGNQRVSGPMMRLAAHLPSDLRNPYLVVLLIVNFFAMVIAIVAGRLTLKHLTGDAAFSAWASLLLLYMSYFNLILGYGIYMMPYDVVSLAIFAVSVWLIVTKRYVALLPVFALGTLNRETTLFIPVFLGFYIWLGGRSESSANNAARWRVAGPSMAAQVLLWIALRLWIRILFLHNPVAPDVASRTFDVHLRQNLVSLIKPQQWPLMLSVFGFTLPLFVAKFRKIGNRALGQATAAILVLWTAAMLLVGVIVEIRIFNELTAFLMPCVALIVWNQWVRPAEECSASGEVV